MEPFHHSPAAKQALTALDKLTRIIKLKQDLFDLMHDENGDRLPDYHYLVPAEECIEQAKHQITKQFAEVVQNALSSDLELIEKITQLTNQKQ